MATYRICSWHATMFYVPPVCRPFPDIANDVVKMKCIGRKFCHRTSAYITIFSCVSIRELPLPDIYPENESIQIIFDEPLLASSTGYAG